MPVSNTPMTSPGHFALTLIAEPLGALEHEMVVGAREERRAGHGPLALLRYTYRQRRAAAQPLGHARREALIDMLHDDHCGGKSPRQPFQHARDRRRSAC